MTTVIISSSLLALFVLAVVVYLWRRWHRMARYGRLDIPCDEVIQLPAGDVTLYYGDSRGLTYSKPFGAPGSFSVLVSDEESGTRIDLGEPEDTISIKNGAGTARIPYATLRTPRAGAYRVTAQINAGDDILYPRVSFG